MITPIKKAIFLLLLSSQLILSGCLGGESVEKFSYVLAVGLDSGEYQKYSITFLMQSDVAGGQGEQKSNEMILVSAEGDNLFDAIQTAESGLPYYLNFSRTNLLAVSCDVAEKGDLESFFSVSFSRLKLRTSANLMVTADRCRDYFEGLNYYENINYSKLPYILIDFYENTGLTNIIVMAEFLTAVQGGWYDAVVPLGSIDESIKPANQSDGAEDGSESSSASEAEDTTGGARRLGGMRSYTNGCALFDGARMVGTLNPQEVQLLLMAQGKLKNANFTFERDDGSTYTIRVMNISQPSIRMTLEPNPHAVVNINLSARLDDDTSMTDMNKMRDEPALVDELEFFLETKLQERIGELFLKCQAMNSDAFGLGRSAVSLFASVTDWENYNFKSKIADVTVDFCIKINLEDIYVASYMN